MSRGIFITDIEEELQCGFFPIPWTYDVDGFNFKGPDLNCFTGNNPRFYENLEQVDEIESVLVHAEIGDYSFLEDFINLRQLYIYADPKLEDLSFITKLEKLKYLHIGDTKVSDITPIAELLKEQIRICEKMLKDEYVHPVLLPRLKCISVQNSKIKDLKAFSGITATLTDFNFRDNEIDSTDGIEGLYISNLRLQGNPVKEKKVR